MALYGVPGFYLVTFALLYLVARAKPEERTEVAGLQYQFCRAYRHMLERQVWNSAFEACLQLYRLGERKNRDKFLQVCLGNKDFWGTSRLSKIKSRIDLRDIMPTCFALFVNATPGFEPWRKQLDYAPERLTGEWADNTPHRIYAAVDLVRKLRGHTVDPATAYKRYLAGTGALGIYLGPLPELMNGLKGASTFSMRSHH